MKPSTKSRESGAPTADRRRPFAADSLLVILLLVAATVGLMSPIFAPISLWPLAFIALVPWLLVVSTSNRPRRVYIASFAVGFGFHLVNLWWISHVTIEGYLALSAYIAALFPLMACPLRHWVRRRRLPLAIGLPVIWVACEYARAMLLTGFPWFFLAHSQHQILSLIQISDLVGAYGVSFVVAAINGAVADILLTRFRVGHDTDAASVPRSTSAARIGAVFALALLVAALLYGQIQLHRDTTSLGPKVAVIQGDYKLSLHERSTHIRPDVKADRYFDLMSEAAGEHPDIYLLPETPWFMYLNKELRELSPIEHHAVRWSRRCYNRFQEWARDHSAMVVTGAFAVVFRPLDLWAEQLNYNSAFVFAPDGSLSGQYDKCHLVLFGEYVPFRFGKLRFLYLWLHQFMPLAWTEAGTQEYSLTAGEEFKVFSMHAPSQGGREYHFGTPICYEDVMPYVSRRFVTGPDGSKRVDFLLNISNDGWFVHSNELPQHLAIGAFRAVENRVGIARAVNTGISGFIDPDGRIHGLVTRNGRYHGPGIDGYSVEHVKVDSRHSLYSRIGDRFAQICMVLWILIYVDYSTVRALSGWRGAPDQETNL